MSSMENGQKTGPFPMIPESDEEKQRKKFLKALRERPELSEEILTGVPLNEQTILGSPPAPGQTILG